MPGNTKAVQLVKPTAELVKTAVVNCAKVGVMMQQGDLVRMGKQNSFFFFNHVTPGDCQRSQAECSRRVHF